MFIQTEATPNPASLKFLPGRDVMGDAPPADFPNMDAAKASPLAATLFAIDGVGSVFFGRDFIVISKYDGYEWDFMKPALLAAIMDHFVAGLPVMDIPADTYDAGMRDAQDDATVRMIKNILDTRIRPAVAQDGGDIIFHDFDAGIVSLHMRGACAGCPSATATLKHGVENLLKHYIPDVKEVRAIL